jgi:DnaK suppressor protein
MPDFNEQQLDQLRDRLTERAMELRNDLRREADEREEHVDVATEAPDPGDSSFANLTVDLSNAAMSRDIFEMRAIEAALGRMDDGSYGECLDCGTDIPYQRLEVQPTAERCTPCQEMHERTHAEGGRGATL